MERKLRRCVLLAYASATTRIECCHFEESRFEEDRVKDAAKYLSRLLRNGELNDFTFLSESDFLKAFKRYAVLLKLAINGTLKFTSSDAVPSAAARDIIEVCIVAAR